MHAAGDSLTSAPAPTGVEGSAFTPGLIVGIALMGVLVLATCVVVACVVSAVGFERAPKKSSKKVLAASPGQRQGSVNEEVSFLEASRSELDPQGDGFGVGERSNGRLDGRSNGRIDGRSNGRIDKARSNGRLPDEGRARRAVGNMRADADARGSNGAVGGDRRSDEQRKKDERRSRELQLKPEHGPVVQELHPANGNTGAQNTGGVAQNSSTVSNSARMLVAREPRHNYVAGREQSEWLQRERAHTVQHENGARGRPEHEHGMRGQPGYENGVRGQPEYSQDGHALSHQERTYTAYHEKGARGQPEHEHGKRGQPGYENGVRGQPERAQNGRTLSHQERTYTVYPENGARGQPEYENGMRGQPGYENGLRGQPERAQNGRTRSHREPTYTAYHENGARGQPEYENGMRGQPGYENGLRGQPEYAQDGRARSHRQRTPDVAPFREAGATNGRRDARAQPSGAPYAIVPQGADESERTQAAARGDARARIADSMSRAAAHDDADSPRAALSPPRQQNSGSWHAIQERPRAARPSARQLALMRG